MRLLWDGRGSRNRVSLKRKFRHKVRETKESEINANISSRAEIPRTHCPKAKKCPTLAKVRQGNAVIENEGPEPLSKAFVGNGR